ncbi:type II 3-dehydroquinate dehydratase [Allobacillus sp. GCM10007491]|uniref:3-dehydroquinate dehydratase n=1 Tax=Allobacillus saliphilus TaxID=2912308 RepID=A0A941CVZ0_9BACI|nr:type II 3-dehydroquinate dehydratase [Allobacillus saliphilus]MBR7554189.1 type II 3-dehydroquinate dehydratase [Allobacillus saliphilus]
MEKILLLNGPNLNMLGKRNPQVYGTVDLDSIEKHVRELLAEHNVSLVSFQSNHEGELIDALHEANGQYGGIIFNPGAYAHTSIAIRDAVEAIATPVVEVHISNIYARESFRQHSYLSPVVSGQITGFGIDGYLMAAYSFLNKQS